MHSEPPCGGLQLHELAGAPVTYLCPRCGWHGNVWKVATVNSDWTALVCERCYEDLHPDIPAVASYWCVSQPGYACSTPQEQMPFTVIRSRAVAGQRGSRDEMYRPHFSQDGDVWEFTSVLVEEAREGSSYDIAEISDDEAHGSWSVPAPDTSPASAGYGGSSRAAWTSSAGLSECVWVAGALAGSGRSAGPVAGLPQCVGRWSAGPGCLWQRRVVVTGLWLRLRGPFR